MKKGGNCKILKEEELVNCQSKNNKNMKYTINDNENTEETLP
jgi:hypothetical protein